MGSPQPKRCFEASVAKRGLFETASAPAGIWCGGEATAPNAVRRKDRRRRERVLAAFEHLWRLRPPLFLEVEPAAVRVIACQRQRLWFQSNMEGSEICRQSGERRRDKAIMAASRLQTKLASCSRLECELSKIPAQKLSERPFRHDEGGNGTALASRGPGAGARQASGAIRPASIPPSSPPASSRAQGRQAGGFRCRTG